MTTIQTPDVGRVWVPELSRVTFGPAFSAGRAQSRAIGIISYTVRDGVTGRKTQAGYGTGIRTGEGLARKWDEADHLQRLYRTAEDFIRAVKHRVLAGIPLPMGVYHNERTNEGSKFVIKQVWGSSLATLTGNNAGISNPTRVALSSASGLTITATDVSLGSASTNVTTNEYTAFGLARTGAITPTGVTVASALDGQFQLTIATTALANSDSVAHTVYGAGLMDNTTSSFNQYAEGTFTAAALNPSDTITTTWTVKD